MQRLTPVLLLTYLTIVGVSWPSLPLNASVADAVFVLLAIAVVSMRMPTLTWHRSDTAVTLYLLGALPAIAVSADPRHSAIEFTRQVYLVAIYLVMAIIARRGLASFIALGLASGGALLSIAGLFFVAVQAVGLPPIPPMGEVMTLPYVGTVLRLRALTPSEAMLACVLTAAVPFAIASCTSQRVRTWCRHVVVMCIAALLTFSHAIAGFAVAVIIAAWLSLGKWPRRVAATIVAVIAVGLNFAATASIKSMSYGSTHYADASAYHYAVDQREITIGDLRVTYNIMSYARIKQVAWSAFIEHPIAGVGLDQFHDETRRAFDEGRLTAAYREIDPHSTLPGRLAETGMIGGVTLLILWLVWARMAIAGAQRSAIELAAAAALAGLMVSSINADIMNFRFLWVIAGLLRGLQDANGIETPSGRDVTAGEPAARTC